MLNSFKCLVRKSMLSVSPVFLCKLQHYKLHKKFGSHSYWANVKNPKTFNERILSSKLDESLRQKGVMLVDKYNVKELVGREVGEKYIIPTLGVFDTVAELRAAKLPRPCVIKPTHLSGRVIFLMSENENLTPKQVKQINGWFKVNHYFRSGEPQYRDLQPRVIVEPFIGEGNEPPVDYKIYCWKGSPEIIQLDSSRFSGHRRDFFTCNWEHLDMSLHYPQSDKPAQKPIKLDEMVNVASKLAKDHDFIRVDLYQVGEDVLFGELTFHPDSGNAPFDSYDTDLNLGKYF